MMLLNRDLLERILYGSALLGSGGGGMISSGMKFIEQIIDLGKPISLTLFPLPPELEEKTACIVCDIGSITAFDERQDDALDEAFEKLLSHFSCSDKLAAVFPIETGPENTMAAFRVAVAKGLTVIDGDGAGRAVPTLPLCLFSTAQLKHRQPVAIANGKRDALLMFAETDERFDTVLRSIAGLRDFKNSASLALWPNPIRTLAGVCVQGAITTSLYCGQLLEGIRENNRKLIDEALPRVNGLRGRLLAIGDVVYKDNSEEMGFNFATTKIRNELNNDTITLLSQNESLIAYSSRQHAPVAVAPDSICFLGAGFYPLTNAEVAPPDLQTAARQRLFVINIRANDALHAPVIKQGFERIVQNLGYCGLPPTEPTDWQPLGDLLLQLPL